MINAVGYTRFSTDRQTENSTKFQMEAISRYAKANDINLLRYYSDEGFSGTNTERPAFQDMCAAADMKLFDAVLIYDITRASRDVVDWMEFRKIMRSLDIQVISVTQHLGDALDPESYLVELINAGIGQHHVLQTRQKSIAGTTAKAREGVFLGGFAPLGYRIEDGKYIIEETEAKYIRMIFDMYAAGKSYNEIIDALGGLKGRRGVVIGKTQNSNFQSLYILYQYYLWAISAHQEGQFSALLKGSLCPSEGKKAVPHRGFAETVCLPWSSPVGCESAARHFPVRTRRFLPFFRSDSGHSPSA